MHLETQKKVAKVVGIGLVAGVSFWGLSKAFNSSSNAPAQPQSTVVVTQPTQPRTPEKTITYTPPVTQTTTAPQTTTEQKKGDSQDEKKQKLGNLQLADKAALEQMGYTVYRRDTNFGRKCDCEETGIGKTDGTGYHGTSTSISYEVKSAQGQNGIICVEHSGKGGVKQKFGQFRAQ